MLVPGTATVPLPYVYLHIKVSWTCGDIVQGDHMRELILLLHQVQLLRHRGIVLEPVLPHLEHHLRKTQVVYETENGKNR